MASVTALRIISIALGLLLAITGADKFFGFLVNWTQYQPPLVAAWFGTGFAYWFMPLAGVMEIIAGLALIFKVRWAGLLAALIFLGIVTSLLLLQGYYNIVLIDIALATICLAVAYADLTH